MKKLGMVLVGLSISLVMTADAGATVFLRYSSTFRGEGMTVYESGTLHGTSGGLYTLNLDVNYPGSGPHGVDETYSDFACLDLEHNAGSAWWEANVHVMPPAHVPTNPPPWDLLMAAYVYKTNRADALTSNAKAAGLQLALWEITHESNWFANYNPATWATNDNFRASGSGTSSSLAARSFATGYMTAAFAARTVNGGSVPAFSGYASYYEPIGNDQPGPSYGQGMLRQTPVPEPTSALLIGLGVMMGAGLRWKRRRRAQ